MSLRTFSAAFAATLAGCNVYDPALLSQPRDAATDVGRDAGTDRGTSPVDLGTPPGDLGATPMDVPAPDAATDAGSEAAVDVVSPTDLGRDVPDVGVDAPPSCATTLAGGAPCIEPVTGHQWNPDDRRLVAPGALVFSNDRLYVSDPGSARVMAYDLGTTAPVAPTRAAGTGFTGTLLTGGGARSTPMQNVTSMVSTTGGTLLLADTDAHSVLRLRDGRLDPVTLALSFPTGPFGMAYAPDTRELFIAGDNRLHVVTLDEDGGVGAASTVVGQMCGGSCPGFNGDGMPGTSTALAFPVGVEVNTTYVYFSDRDNCRVRRYRRDDPMRRVETFAGSDCDLTGDPLTGAADGFRARAALRLGRVTDVRIGVDQSIYFVDASHCAVFQVLAPALSTARIVAGSRLGCGQVDPSDGAAPIVIGRVGGLAVSADRASLFVSDAQLQRVLRVENTAMGGTPRVTVAQAPGATPAADEPAALLRVGHPSALAVLNDAATILVAGQVEGRLYRVQGGRTSVLLGDGTTVPAGAIDPVLAGTLPSTWVAGLGGDGDHAVLGMPERGVVADLRGIATGATLRRVAGRYEGVTGDAGVVRDAGDDARVAATEASFQRPAWPFTQGGQTWFGDAAGRVWRVTTSADAGVAEIVAGSGAAGAHDGGAVPAGSAPLGSAVGFALGGDGTLYVADAARYVVWGVSAAGEARVVAGVLDRPAPLGDDAAAATERGLAQPVALAYDGTDTLYVADAAANRVRAVTLGSGQMSTFAGSGPPAGTAPGSSGDFGPARSALLARPTALAWSRSRLYVAEGASGRVRVITRP